MLQLIEGQVELIGLGTASGTPLFASITNLPADQGIHLTSGVGFAIGTPLFTQVTNFPASQAITGTVGVNNFPATQNVAITVGGVAVSAAAPLPVILSGAPVASATALPGGTGGIGWLSQIAYLETQSRPVTQSGAWTVAVNNLPADQGTHMASGPGFAVGSGLFVTPATGADFGIHLASGVGSAVAIPLFVSPGAGSDMALASNQAALATIVGAVVVSPAANTLLDRLKTIATLTGDNTAAPPANTVQDRIKQNTTALTTGTAQRTADTVAQTGTAITAGATLSAGGAGLVGWLSQVDKEILSTNAKLGSTTDTTSALGLLRLLYQAQAPTSTEYLLSLTTGVVSTNALTTLVWRTLRSFPIPALKTFVPKHFGLFSGNPAVMCRAEEQVDFGRVTKANVFADGFAPTSATEWWDDVDLEIVTAFAGGVDPVPVTVNFLDDNNAAQSVVVNLRRGDVAGQRYPVAMPAGVNGLRDVTSLTLSDAAATAGVVRVIGSRELSLLSCGTGEARAATILKMGVKSGRTVTLAMSSSGGGGVTLRATVAGTLEAEV